MRVLIVSTGIPFPPANGGLLRTYHLAHSLCQNHEVTLACFSFEKSDPPSFPCRIIDVPWELPQLYQDMVSVDETVAARATHTLQHETKEPWLASFYDLPAMEEVLRRESAHHDVVIFEGSDTARFMQFLPNSLPKILDFMDVHSAMSQRDTSRIEEGTKAKIDATYELRRIIDYEKDLASRTLLCLTCSDLESDHARKLLGASNLYVFSNGVDTSFHTPSDVEPEPNSFLFVGTLNYAANIEAVHYFIRDIFPLIRHEIPDAQFHIVGSRAVESLKQLGKEPGVTFHGRVEDIRPYAWRAAVSVIPLLSGGGTRSKILEGAAQGKAMVSTAIGAEGLNMRHGKELIIADTPEDFAKAAITLARNPEMRREFGTQACKVSFQYDWKKIENEFLNFFENLAPLQGAVKARRSQAADQANLRQPLVSIIVNNFNYGRFVGEAIESALNQTYANKEVIVVDDGSTDNSHEVIDRYHDCIKVVFKENGGQTSAWNVGFTQSGGEIVVFLDADDRLTTDAVETAVKLFNQDSNIVRVHWPLWVVDEQGRRTRKKIPSECLAEGDLRETVLRDGPDSYGFAPTSGNAWARKFLKEVFPLPEVEKSFGIGSASADAHLSMLVPFYGRIKPLAEPRGFYRLHGGNSSKRPFAEKMRRDLLKFDNRTAALLEFCNEKRISAHPENWKNGAYQLKAAICEIETLIPAPNRFILVDDENWGLDETVFGGRHIPFLERGGQYWGPPSDDETAIKELGRLRDCGASHLVFAWPSFWWLKYYTGFVEYLRLHYYQELQNDRMVVFDLKVSRSKLKIHVEASPCR